MNIPITSLRAARKLLVRLPFTRATLPVLTHVLATAGTGGITLAVSDLDHWLETRVAGPDPVRPDERLLIPANVLADAARADRGSEARFTCHYTRGGRELIVATVRDGMPVESRHPTEDPAEHPSRPEVAGGVTREISARTFASLKAVAGCASSDSTRHVLNGVLLTRAEGGRVAATDGKKLAVAPATLPPRDLILPNRAVHVLAHPDFLAGGASLTVPTDPERKGSVAIRCGGHWFALRPIEGHYPNFWQVVPAELPFTAALPPSHRAGVVGWLRSLRGRSRSVRLTWPEPGRLVLIHRDAAGNTATMAAPVEVEGPGTPPEILFDAANLAVALEIAPTLCLLDEMTPGMTRGDDGRFCVLMPMRFSRHHAEPAQAAAPQAAA